jgi:hypothetical protein
VSYLGKLVKERERERERETVPLSLGTGGKFKSYKLGPMPGNPHLNLTIYSS